MIWRLLGAPINSPNTLKFRYQAGLNIAVAVSFESDPGKPFTASIYLLGPYWELVVDLNTKQVVGYTKFSLLDLGPLLDDVLRRLAILAGITR